MQDTRGKVEEESWSGREKVKTRREEKALKWEKGKESGAEEGEGESDGEEGKESK